MERFWKWVRSHRILGPMIIVGSLVSGALAISSKIPDGLWEAIYFWSPRRAMRFETPHGELAEKGRVTVFAGERPVFEVPFSDDSSRVPLGGYEAQVRVHSRTILKRDVPLTEGDEPQVTSIADTATVQGQIKTPDRVLAGVRVEIAGRTTVSGDDGTYVLTDLPLQSKYQVRVHVPGRDEAFESNMPALWRTEFQAPWNVLVSDP